MQLIHNSLITMYNYILNYWEPIQSKNTISIYHTLH